MRGLEGGFMVYVGEERKKKELEKEGDGETGKRCDATQQKQLGKQRSWG